MVADDRSVDQCDRGGAIMSEDQKVIAFAKKQRIDSQWSSAMLDLEPLICDLKRMADLTKLAMEELLDRQQSKDSELLIFSLLLLQAGARRSQSPRLAQGRSRVIVPNVRLRHCETMTVGAAK